MKGKKPQHYNHNGLRMPMGFPPEGFTSGINYIVWLIHNDGQPLSLSKTILEVSLHLEGVGKEAIVKFPHPRIELPKPI